MKHRMLACENVSASCGEIARSSKSVVTYQINTYPMFSSAIHPLCFVNQGWGGQGLLWFFP